MSRTSLISLVILSLFAFVSTAGAETGEGTGQAQSAGEFFPGIMHWVLSIWPF